jgi:endonuclease/exonuclease/phosphatase family metal-dependent hydrolase
MLDVTLSILTLNLRNTNDRYTERLPLLTAGFASLAPDIAALQEVDFSGERQDHILANAAPRDYRSTEARLKRNPDFGTSILCAAGEPQAHEVLHLNDARVAHRVLLALPGKRMLWFANTHLHHRPAEDHVRLQQVEAILRWIEAAPAADAIIIAGDFNAPPGSASVLRLQRAGFRSAFAEANSAEPPFTWPSGIQAETIDTDGDPATLDYIWLSGTARATAARLVFNAHAPADPTLYPSDHFGILATVSL